jgi:protein-S-isoprenylcysteine O-methyltransferase Ste14
VDVNFAIRTFSRAASLRGPARWALTLLGLLFFVSIITLLVAGSLWTDMLLGLPPIPLGSVSGPISVVVGACGAALAFWSFLQFARARGTPVPFNPPRSIVRTGPYACCRNPMLTGLFVFLYGIAIGIESISMFNVFIPMFIIFNYVELKYVEEPELEMRFGEEYMEYKRETPMFLLRLGGKKT